MRKILFILIACLSIISCNNLSTSGEYDKEFIEFAQQFNLLENIDTINLVYIDAKAFQILDENTCLANEKDDLGYHFGDIVYILTNDLLYDDAILNGEFILLGTYQYTSKDSKNRTIKAYSSKDFYIEYINMFNAIKEINN